MNQKILLNQDTLSMKRELIKIIPINSDVGLAKKLLEENRFKTKWIEQSDFVESNPFLKINKLYKKINYLYGDLEQSKGLISFISERWQVAVVYADRKVTDIHISYGKTGP